MISGALEIIHGVRPGLVHPLLLPGSQGPDMLGYIVIAYEDQKDVFDILFVRGSTVVQYAGIHRELKILLSEKTVRAALAASGTKCRLYLFSLTRPAFNSFLSTFHCHPSLMVPVCGLSKKQIAALAVDVGCTNGIMEVASPARPLPRISLLRFFSRDLLLEQATRARDGRLIIYDLELNAVIRQRGGGKVGDPPPDAGRDVPPVPGPPVQSVQVSVGEGDPGPDPGQDHPAECAGAPPAGDIAAAFETALHGLRSAVAETCGPGLQVKLESAMREHFPPEGHLTPGTAGAASLPLVLSLIEDAVHDAWVGKRRRLRARALEIVRVLYEEHHELLRAHGLEEAVQGCYRRLRT